ncbi:MAG: diguanylate cyclase [Ancalomicrobiaceae bacterium]|nr:diguanylate cyclase [Ancalomicrobiaceae bacterium]
MRIVLVEPSRLGLKIMTALLEQCGHSVVAFRDGAEALERLKTDETLELVVTALELPGLGGLELCWQARTLTSQRRQLYVIAMSSSHDHRRLSEALDSGADDFISKPPNPYELSARLRAAERWLAAQRELMLLATRDGLTGILNRRAFIDQASTALDNAQYEHTPASVIMIDIDHFKRINDRFGHEAGDRVIQQLGSLIGGDGALAGRLGGEEFAILTVGLREAEATAEANAIRCAFAATEFRCDGSPQFVTASFGVAEASDGDCLSELLRRADHALYAAKASGRNRVIAATRIRLADDHGDAAALASIDSDRHAA